LPDRSARTAAFVLGFVYYYYYHHHHHHHHHHHYYHYFELVEFAR
jgi:hypothetical protein